MFDVDVDFSLPNLLAHLWFGCQRWWKYKLVNAPFKIFGFSKTKYLCRTAWCQIWSNTLRAGLHSAIVLYQYEIHPRVQKLQWCPVPSNFVFVIKYNQCIFSISNYIYYSIYNYGMMLDIHPYRKPLKFSFISDGELKLISKIKSKSKNITFISCNESYINHSSKV